MDCLVFIYVPSGVAVRETSCSAESCSCFSDNTCHFSSLTCGCPCTSPLDFYYCRSQFPNSSLPICPSPAPQIESSNDKPPSTSGLQKCFDPHCKEKNSSQTCDGVVSCYWCKYRKDDTPLDRPYCAGAEVCFRGKEVDQGGRTTENPKLSSPKGNQGSDGLSNLDLVGIAIGCTAAVLIVAITVIVVVIRCRNHQSKPAGTAPQKQTITAEPKDQSNRPPAPLPPGSTPVYYPDSAYDTVDELRNPRRASIMSEMLERSRVASVLSEVQGPQNVRRASIISEQPECSRAASVRSDYDAPETQNVRRGPVMSNNVPERTRGALVVAHAQGPRPPREPSVKSGQWPWPYNDVGTTSSETQPPIPLERRPPQQGLDNDGYMKSI